MNVLLYIFFEFQGHCFISLATLVCTYNTKFCRFVYEVLIINSYCLSYFSNIQQLMLTPCDVVPFPVHTGGEVNCSAFVMEGNHSPVPHTRDTAPKIIHKS